MKHRRRRSRRKNKRCSWCWHISRVHLLIMVRFHATAYASLVRVEVPTNRSEVTSEDAKGKFAVSCMGTCDMPLSMCSARQRITCHATSWVGRSRTKRPNPREFTLRRHSQLLERYEGPSATAIHVMVSAPRFFNRVSIRDVKMAGLEKAPR